MADDPDWNLWFYCTEMGNCPVADFLDEVAKAWPLEYGHYKELIRPKLVRRGPLVGQEIWKGVGDGLAEVRWHGRGGQFRIYCSIERGRRIVMYEGRKKDFRAMWHKDKKTCRKRRQEYLTDPDDQERRYFLYMARKAKGNQ